MIGWLTASVAWACAAAGVFTVVLGLAGRKPSDLSVGLLGLGIFGVIVLGVVAAVSAWSGHGASGDVVEWLGYWLSCLLVGVGAGFWALVQRDRWGTIVLALALLTIAVMVVRLEQVWFASGWA